MMLMRLKRYYKWKSIVVIMNNKIINKMIKAKENKLKSILIV